MSCYTKLLPSWHRTFLLKVPTILKTGRFETEDKVFSTFKLQRAEINHKSDHANAAATSTCVSSS